MFSSFPDRCEVWRRLCVAGFGCTLLLVTSGVVRAQTSLEPAAPTPHVVVHGVASHFDLIDLGPDFSEPWLEGLLPAPAAPPALAQRITTTPAVRGPGQQTRTTYDRTTTGKLLGQRVERRTDRGWTNVSRTRYVYRDGMLVGQRTAIWSEGAWQPDRQLTFARSARGEVREVVYRTRRAARWVKTARISIQPPDTTRQRRLVRARWADGRWAPHTRVTFTVAEEGRHIVQRNETWTGTRWEDSVRLTFMYDGAGYPIEKTAEVWTGVEWAEGPLSLYDYEMHERRIVQRVETWIGANRLRTERSELTYTAPLRAWLTEAALRID